MMHKSAAEQLIEWIDENPNKADKAFANWGGTDHPDDIAEYKNSLLGQLQEIIKLGG